MTPLAFPLDVAAERLGLKRRWLQDWLREHPCDVHGIAFYRSAGKAKLFTETDLVRILATLPQPEALPCSSSTRHVKAARTGASAANTSESTLSAALALATAKSPSEFSPSGRAKSNVVHMPDRPTRH